MVQRALSSRAPALETRKRSSRALALPRPARVAPAGRRVDVRVRRLEHRAPLQRDAGGRARVPAQDGPRMNSVSMATLGARRAIGVARRRDPPLPSLLRRSPARARYMEQCKLPSKLRLEARSPRRLASPARESFPVDALSDAAARSRARCASSCTRSGASCASARCCTRRTSCSLSLSACAPRRARARALNSSRSRGCRG